jgi:hypothetical protein
MEYHFGYSPTTRIVMQLNKLNKLNELNKLNAIK